MIDLNTLTVSKASDALDSKTFSSVELIEATLKRIEETEPFVHAFAHVTAARALEEAHVADREPRRGPLHGIPFAVKDVLETRDVPTEAGSRVLAGFVPLRDATAVRRLRDAGAILIGKHVTRVRHRPKCAADSERLEPRSLPGWLECRRGCVGRGRLLAYGAWK
jgi:Asp-tRNA(Asn)/Glu-tRNA(Gln) amidotransferase A subunit family amidase